MRAVSKRFYLFQFFLCGLPSALIETTFTRRRPPARQIAFPARRRNSTFSVCHCVCPRSASVRLSARALAPERSSAPGRAARREGARAGAAESERCSVGETEMPAAAPPCRFYCFDLDGVSSDTVAFELLMLMQLLMLLLMLVMVMVIGAIMNVTRPPRAERVVIRVL